jgi:hypothetical protein
MTDRRGRPGNSDSLSPTQWTRVVTSCEPLINARCMKQVTTLEQSAIFALLLHSQRNQKEQFSFWELSQQREEKKKIYVSICTHLPILQTDQTPFTGILHDLVLLCQVFDLRQTS